LEQLTHLAALHEVDKAARGRDDDVGALLHRAQLRKGKRFNKLSTQGLNFPRPKTLRWP
jgi:hypothetical protein